MWIIYKYVTRGEKSKYRAFTRAFLVFSEEGKYSNDSLNDSLINRKNGRADFVVLAKSNSSDPVPFAKASNFISSTGRQKI